MDGPAINSAATDANPFDAIEADMLAALDGVGAGMAETVQEFISIDVERIGSHVIRSQPGEHPRRDTGRLFGSIEHDTGIQDHVITVTVDTDTPYAPYLENGTPRMAARPIFEGMLERFEPILLDTAISVIENQ